VRVEGEKSFNDFFLKQGSNEQVLRSCTSICAGYRFPHASTKAWGRMWPTDPNAWKGPFIVLVVAVVVVVVETVMVVAVMVGLVVVLVVRVIEVVVVEAVVMAPV